MNIEGFCNSYGLGKVISIDKITGGLMHKMFKVVTDKSTYCVKLLNPEVMSRSEAYNNFVVSEKISNFAKNMGIPVSNAIEIDGNFLNKYNNLYYMVFEYVNGRTLKDNEITVNHCKKIGEVLADIHSLDYKELGLDVCIDKSNKVYDWESYIDNANFNKMSYKDMYLSNYKKYGSILKRANERFNHINNIFTITHSDMDPKNVMWDGNNPIIIDWECASLANPYIELLEDALCWSGFLTNNFDEEKFRVMFEEYSRYRNIDNVDWYDVICGNMIGRFNWLKYNLDRSLGLISNDHEEIKIATKEVIKTIDEINRYLDLIGNIDDIIIRLITKELDNYDDIVKKIIGNNELLRDKQFKIVTAGFTNTIYEVQNYIIRICTDINNEERFKREIEFYKNNNVDGIPKLFISDVTKSIVPYYYDVIEKVSGKTLYEVWYKLSDDERKDVITKIINILKQIHLKDVDSYNFLEFIKDKVSCFKDIDYELYNKLIMICNKYFNDNKFGLIHGDLHFDNFIYNGKNLYLIDFERYMVAPIDYEFRIFNTCKIMPWLWASGKSDMITVESDYQDLMDMILDNYDELKEIPYINERLDFYTILELLNNYKNTNNEDVLSSVKKLINKVVL